MWNRNGLGIKYYIMSNVGSLFEFIEAPNKKEKESRQKNNQYNQSGVSNRELLLGKRHNNSILKLQGAKGSKERKPFVYKTQIKQLKKGRVLESITKSKKFMVDGQNLLYNSGLLDQTNTKLTIDQGLLRALHQVNSQVKEKNNEQTTKKKHQKSIQRRGLSLSKIKMVPFKSWQLDSSPSPKKRRVKGIKIRVDNENSESLTKERRIEYQACLFWAKKHKKDQSFYEKQLSKGKTKNEVYQITQRKNFKFTIKKKHSGVRIYSQSGTLPLLEKAVSEGQEDQQSQRFSMPRQNIRFENGESQRSINKLILSQRSKTTIK